MTVGDQRQDTQDADDGSTFSLRVGGSWDVTLTMPDTGQTVTFTFGLAYGSFEASAGWTPPRGVYASLWCRPVPPRWSLYRESLPSGRLPATKRTGRLLTGPASSLRLKDGTQYYIAREDLGEHFYADDSGNGGFVHAYGTPYLSQVTKPDGSKLEFVRAGTALQEIDQFNAATNETKSLVFERDAQNRIIAAYGPDELGIDGNPSGPANLTYAYDASGNLTNVSKLVDSSNPASPVYSTTTFLYALPQFPHFITQVIDPRGVTTMRAQFDSSGRFIGTLNAYGQLLAVSHNPGAQTETVFDRLGNATVLLHDDRGNVLAATDPLGNTTTHTYDANNNELTLTDPLGHTTTKTYDASGNVLTLTDALGNTTTCTYDANGNRLTKTDAMGNTISTVYDGGNHPITQIDALGNKIQHQYDASGNLKASISASGTVAVNFAYDANGNVNSAAAATGLSQAFSFDGLGNPTSAQYQWVNPNNSNDIQTVGSSAVYNAAGQLIYSSDSEGKSTTRTYDAAGHLLQVTDDLGLSTVNTYDPLGNKIQTQDRTGTLKEWVYDADGRVTAETSAHLPGRPGNGTEEVYDADGRLILAEATSNMVISITTVTNGGTVIYSSALVSAGGIQSSNAYAYDAAGRLVASTDPTGATTQYEYDADGHNTAIVDALGNRTEFAFDADGNKSMMRDPLGRETYYLHDADGQLTKTVYPDGTSTSATYDPNGNTATRTDQAGETIQYGYDNAGRLAAVVLPPTPDPERTNAPAQPTSNYHNDQYGNVLVQTDAKQRNTLFAYDQYQHVTTRTLPMGQSEFMAYNNQGQMQQHTDFDGQVTTFTYDPLGRLSAKSFFAAGSNVPSATVAYGYDALARLTNEIDARGVSQYTYDTDGKVLMIVTPEGTIQYGYDPATDRRIRTWTTNSDLRYAYDTVGRLSSVTEVARNGQPLSPPAVASYTYDAVGNRQSLTLPNGLQNLYQYDQMSRLTRLIQQDASSNLLASYTYTFNVKGQRTTITEIKPHSASGALETNFFAYGYDALGRLTAETNVFSFTNQSGFVAQYTYDLVGNRLSRQVSVGSSVLMTTYAYDANDRLLMESNSLTSGAPHSLRSGSGTLVPVRSANGSIELRYRPAATSSAYYLYHAIPYFVALGFLLPAAFIPRLKRQRRFAILSTELTPQRALLPRCLSGLLAAIFIIQPFESQTLADEAGLYAALSTAEWGLNGSIITYQYDQNGSVTKKLITGPQPEEVDYTYDLQNQLNTVSDTTSNGTQVVVKQTLYTCDQNGNRVRSEMHTSINGVQTSGSTNICLIDALNPTGVTQTLEESPAVGAAPSVSYMIGDEVLSQTVVDADGNAATDYYLYDGHGSTRQLADSGANVTASYAYGAYGMMVGGNPTAAAPARTKLLYSGQAFDSGLQQYNLRARDYDPSNGRFTSMDSYYGSYDDPQSLHKYAYTHCDPVNFTDPTGHDLIQLLVTISIIATLGAIIMPIGAAAIACVYHGLSFQRILELLCIPPMCNKTWHDATTAFIQGAGLGALAYGATWAAPLVGVSAGLASLIFAVGFCFLALYGFVQSAEQSFQIAYGNLAPEQAQQVVATSIASAWLMAIFGGFAAIAKIAANSGASKNALASLLQNYYRRVLGPNGMTSIARLKQFIQSGITDSWNPSAPWGTFAGEKYVGNVFGIEITIRWHGPNLSPNTPLGSPSRSNWAGSVELRWNGNEAFLGSDGAWYDSNFKVNGVPNDARAVLCHLFVTDPP